MSIAGKFTDILADVQGAHPQAHVHVGTVSTHAPSNAIIVPDAHLLFHGDFKRAGVDLVLSDADHELILRDYFKGEKRAALASPDGAHLTGDIVSALTGHTQFAQADGSASVAPQVIGHVTKLAGTATAIRNGVSIILNQGDNVHKGDVVQSGSDSTLGITFIDGTVFGLGSNAKMVLNEMIYDPNGSDNKSLLSLVQGTISFVAGATAKHGDMKIDTPVATMGIRGTAVLVEIDFEVSVQGNAPPVKFQVLVEPDGTTGSYILFDKVTLTPIATVNQAGTATIVNGQGGVNFLSSAQLSSEAQKLVIEVFTQKFTDLNNTNTKQANNQGSSTGSDTSLVKLSGGETIKITAVVINVADKVAASTTSTSGDKLDHIPGKPEVVTTSDAFIERANLTASALKDSVTGEVRYADINAGDQPSVTTKFDSFTYQNAAGVDVTAALTGKQLTAIHSIEAPLAVVQDAAHKNIGTATWTYTVDDGAFDFLAAGEKLTLNYIGRVDNNFAANNEFKEVPLTITITGTNDKPVITTAAQSISFTGGKTTPGGPLTTTDATSGTLSFTDVDLTDTHTVSTKLTSALLSGAEIGTLAPAPLKIFEAALTASIATGNDSTQKNIGTINWQLADLAAYLADFVPAGDTLTLVYTVTVTDLQGATSTQNITVTITGDNTPAVVWIATEEGGSTGDWNDAANWETGTVPTGTDDTIIITDQLQDLTPYYPVTINAPAFAKTLLLNDFGTTPPELDNNSTLQIGGTFDLLADSIVKNTGTISVGGAIEVQGTSQFTNSGALNLAQGGDFKDSSSITNAASGVIDLTGGVLTDYVAIVNDGLIKVETGAKLVLNGGSIDGGAISNFATIEISGTGSITNDALANTQLTVDSGQTLTIDGSTITGGAVTNSGATLKVNATKTATLNDVTVTGGDITDGGTVRVGSGKTLTLNGVALDGGIVTNDGTIEISGTGSITNDALANTQLTVDGGQTLTIDGSTITGGAVTNTGATLKVNATKTATLNDVTVTGGDITDGGTVHVGAGKTLTLNGVALDGGIVTNDGTIEISGTGSITNDALANTQLTVDSGQTLTIDGSTITGGAVTNTGATLKVNATKTATLNDVTVTGGDITDGGTVHVGAGKTLTLNGVALDGGIVTNDGTIEIAGTGSITNDALANTQLTVDSGQTLTIDGSTITGGAVTNTGATLKVNATKTATLNDVTVTGGDITDGGTVHVGAGKTLTLNGVALDGGIVTNDGTIEISGTGSITNDALANTQLTVDSGQTLTIDGTTITGGAVTNTGATLKVNATKTATLNDVTVTGGDITDGGTVHVGAGKTLTLNGVALDGGIVTNDGTIEIAGTGSITNDALANTQLTVDSGQTLTIDGSTITGGAVTNTGATLKVNATKTATLNDVTVTGGDITDGGTVHVGAGKTLTLNGVALDGGIVTNDGTIEISGTGSITNDALANTQLTVDSGQTLTIDGSTITGGAVTNTGATLKVNATKTATLNDVTVTGGDITDGGTVHVGAGKTLTLNGVALDGGIVTNDGTIEISGTGSITNDALANTQLTVNSGQTLTIDGTTITGGTVTNTGATLKVNATKTATLNNVTVTGGDITDGGTVVIDSGKTLTLNGVALDGGIVTNDGTIEISGSGSITNDTLTNTSATGSIIQIDDSQTLTIGGTTITGGTINEGAGSTIVVSGASTIDGGAKLNNGAVTVDAQLTLDTVTVSGTVITDNASIVLDNTVKLKGGATIQGGPVTNNGTLEIAGAASLLNDTLTNTSATGSIIQIDDSQTLTIGGTTITGGTINEGAGSTIVVSGASTIDGGAKLNNGAVTVGAQLTLDKVTVSGTVITDNASIVLDNNVTLKGGATIQGGPVTNNGTLEIAGAASLLNDTLTNASASGSIIQIDDNQTLTLSGTGITGGTVNISSPSGTGGAIDVTGDSSLTDAGLNNGHIQVENGVALTLDNDTVTGTSFEVTGGASPLGNLILTNGTTVEGSQITVDTSAQLTLDGATITDGAVTNNGKIDVTDDSTLNGAASVANTDLAVESGVTLTLAGTASIDGGTVTNDGTIETSATNSLTNVDLTNAGTIEATAGTLTITGSVLGGGSIKVDAGAFLDLDATVAAAQTIEFVGAGSSEVELDAATFGGQIKGMAATDEIDLRTISYGLSTTATYDSNAGNTGGVLTVTDGINSISMTLVGDYRHAHFAGATDGHGGTLVTLNALDDGPAFTVEETAQTGAFAELSDKTGFEASNPTTPLTGTVHFTDIDLVDRPTATITSQTVTWTVGETDIDLSTQPGLATQFAALEQALQLTQPGNTNNGAIHWTYSVVDGDLDFLAAGQTATVTSTITLNDHEGATDTATVTVTITGANDAPAVAVDSSGADNSGLHDIAERENVAGSSTADTATGSLSFTDVDLTDTHTVSQAPPTFTWLDSTGQPLTLTAGQQAALTAASTLALTPHDSTGTGAGSVDFTYSAADSTFDFLAAGEKLQVTYNVTVTDYNNGVATGTSSTKPVTITITGSDDAPVVTNQAPLTFATSTFAAGAGPELGGIADFNGDGKPDFAVADIYGDSVSVLLNDGNGGFQSPITYSVGLHPNTVAVGDLNGDGKADLVTVPGDFNARVTVLLGDGTGHFQVQGTTFQTPLNGLVSDLADLNGDGKLDVVVTDQYTATGASVLLGNGDGTFGAATSYGGGQGYFGGGRIADVNGDGKLDLISGTPGGFAVLLGDGNGGFGNPTNHATGDASIDVGDLNGDGKLDVVAGTAGGLKVLLGNGDGTFQAPTVYASANGGPTVSDVNGDGRPDVVLTSYSGNSVSVLLGNGDGTLQAATTYAAGQNPIHASVADLNGDGKADLIVSDVEGGAVTVLLNTGPASSITERAGTTDSSAADTASGSLTFTDLDLTDSHDVAITGVSPTGVTSGLADHATQLGWLTLGDLSDSTGGVTGSRDWNFSAPDKAFDYLADGETLTLTYTVAVDDQHGGTTVQDVVIVVTGTNDGPVVAASGSLDLSDIIGISAPANSNDGGSHPRDENVWSVNGSPINDASGIGYLVNPSYQADVSSGEYTLHDHVYIAPYQPDPTRAVVTFHFDKPTLVTEFDVIEHANGVTKLHGYAGNSLDSLTDVGAVFGSLGDITGDGVLVNGELNVFQFTNSITATYFQVVIEKTSLSWGYALFRMYPVGTQGADAGLLVEASSTSGSATTDTASATLLFTDADLSNTHTVDQGDPAFAWSGGSLTTTQINALTAASTLTLDPADSTGTGAGSVGFSYSAADGNFDFLAAGQTLTITYDVTVTDSDGATSTHPVTITVTGTNDAPTVDVVTRSVTDTSANDSFSTVTGVLVGHDLDSGETAGLTYAAIDSASHAVNTAVAGSYGSLTVGTNGSYSYAPDAAVINALHAGNYTDTFTVQTADAHGAIGTTTVTINVTGANDSPTLTAVTRSITDTAADDSFATLTGTLVGNDLDSGETATLSYATIASGNQAVNTAVTGTYGSLTVGTNGSYSYAANAAAINALGAGNFTDTFTVRTTDSHGAPGTSTFTVNITGVNDGPAATGFSITNAAPSGSGWILDTDNGHYYRLVTTNLSWSAANAAAQSDGAYLATITSQAEQNLLATLAAGNRAWLGGGATDDATGTGHFNWLTGPEAGSPFNYTHWRPGEPSGFFGATEYVHIEGVDDPSGGGWNDAPDGASGRDFIEEWGGLSGQVAFREDTGTTLTTAQLLAHATDVDSSLTVSAVSATSAHGGTVSLNGNIVTYHPAADYNGADSFTYTVSDGSLTSTATVTFNVAAVNDAPAASAPSTHYSATAQSNLSLRNTGLSVSDVDGGSGVETATLSASQGIITIGAGDSGVTGITGNGTGSVSFSGTLAQINALLNTSAGTVVYNDNAGPSAATVALTLTVHDNGNTGGGDLSASASSTIDVASSGPLAFADTVSAVEDTATAGLGSALKLNDQGSQLTVVSVANAQHGTVVLNGGNPIFTPDANFSGQASFTYWVSNAASPPVAGAFQAATSTAAGSGAFAVATADLNGDGKLDIVVTNNSGGNASVLLGNGNGTFAAATTLATQANPFAVKIGDIDGDGDADIVIANLGSDSISVMLGNGTGSFAAQQTYAVGDAPEGVVLGDFNGDGKIDVVTSGANGSSNYLLLGNGNGTFAAASAFGIAGRATNIAAGDFNGDGKLDVVTTNYNTNTVSVSLGNGLGGFTTTAPSVGGYPLGVIVADLNGDGRLDFVTANNTSNNISVLLGNGDGTFQSQVNYSTGANPADIAATDFDQDGKLDLVVTNASSISVFHGNGNGTFNAAVNYTAGTTPGRVATGDFNGDGLVDIVVADSANSTVNVLFNGSPGSTLSSATVTVDVAPRAETPALTLNLAPQPLGNEFRVNSTTANDQSYSAIGALSDGGFLVAWGSAGQDGSGTGVYAQRYDASGATVGVEFRVNTATFDDQSKPFIASLAGGGFVVTWTSGNNNGASIHGQVYNTAGAAVGSEFTVATGENSTVAALANGGFVVTYVSTDGDTGGTFFQLYNASGTAVGSSHLVNTTTVSQQQGDSVAGTPDGGFIASWHSYGQDAANTWGVYFQRFDASGNKIGGEIRANSTAAGDQYGGELAVLKDGTFVISWIDTPTNSLVLRHFDASGSPLGSEISIANVNPSSSDTVQALADGGYVVTYMGNDAAGSLGLFGQRFEASGALDGAAFSINQTIAGDQGFLADRSTPTAVLTSGKIVSTWFGAPNVSGTEIYARLFSPPGTGSEDTAIKLGLVSLGADHDGSESAVIKLSGYPAGATFSKGAAGTGADAGLWVISNATEVASLSTTPLTMTPPSNYNGTFTLHVTAIATDTATLTSGVVTDTATTTRDMIVTVTPVNDAAVAVADTISAASGQATAPLGAILKSNDSNPDGASSTIVSVSDAVHGTVALNGGNPVFTPDAGFTGQASFTYWISDASSPAAPGTFGAATNYAIGNSAYSIQTADINGDGKADIVSANAGSSTISILLGNGNGTFQSQTTIAQSSAEYVALADLNGDLKADIIVADYAAGQIDVRLGNGNGTFQSAVAYNVGSGPLDVKVADVNGDGKRDLVVLNNGSSSVSVLLGNGNGTFQSQVVTSSVGSATQNVLVDDFNRDGNADIAVSSDTGNNVKIMLGNGSGSFTTLGSYAANSRPDAGTAGDVNGDGILDLVFGNNTANTVSVLLGNGDGSFRSPVAYAVGTQPAGVTISDVNEDGRADLVVGNSGGALNSPGTVSVLLGNGDGTFQAQTLSSTDLGAVSVVTADFNGDGRPDIAASNRFSNDVSVLLNASPGGTLSSATVTVNASPLAAVADTISTNANTATSGLGATLKANDTGGTSTIVSVANAQHGTVALNGGNPIFTPDAGFSGQASFTYTISNAASPPAPGTFGTTVNYAAGTYPQAVTIADINADGKLDLLTSNYTTNSVSVMYGNGNGTFQAPGSLLAGTSTSTEVVVADFTGDGKVDLAVGNYGSHTISVWINNGSGAFNPGTTISASNGAEGLTSGDLNNDGKTDLVVTNYDVGTVGILIGNGNGTFQSPTNYNVGNNAYVSALGDFNRDGKLDIVVANASSNYASVLIGNGDGTFHSAVNYAMQSASNSVAVGDVNGDGKLDFVTSDGSAGKVSVFLGNGDGTFQAETTFATAGLRDKGIALADMNEDGKLDIVVGNSRDPAAGASTNSVSVLLGNGQGGFGSPTTLATGWDTYGVSVADLNGDGRPDIVAPNELSDNVSVILNAAPGGTLSTTTVTVNVSPAVQLVNTSFLGGAGDQAASAVTYSGGHLYLTYNAPMNQNASDHSTVVGLTAAADGTTTQNFSDAWSYGYFNGVAADGNSIYAVGGSHPSAGLTHDGVGGAEEKTIAVAFNADGSAGSNPSPAAGYAANNFFGYTGTEIFQNVLATTQGGASILYAMGFGQPASYGAYILAEYTSTGTLLHSATDPLATPGFSNAYDAVEFNGAIWAVGNTQHSGDATNTATVWKASYDLSSVVTYKDTLEAGQANFTSVAAIGNAVYAAGGVTANGGDYLVAKYNANGTVAWSHAFGGGGADTLNGAVALNGHLYVVGSTTSGGNTDGVLMEINTTDGSVVSTTTYGGALYDSFSSITTDGHYLYVAGESKSFTNGGNGAGQDDAVLLTYSPSAVIAGDLAAVTVKGGGVQLTGLATTVTTADLQAIDAGFTADQLTYTVTGTNHGHLATSINGAAITSFTQAQLNSGSIYFVAENATYTGQADFTVSLSDGAAARPATSATMGIAIVDAQFTVLTTGGYDFDQANSIGKMGSGTVVPDGTDSGHAFQIVNAAQGSDFIFSGTGFTYGANNALTGGTITSIHEVTHSGHAPIANFDLSVAAADWYDAVVAQAGGDQSVIEALTRPWTFNFIGNSGADSFFASDVNDIFTGRGSDDLLGGEFGYDRANYGAASGPIAVQLAAGIVTGTGANASGVGTDTLQSIEMVTGSDFADTFNSVGFSSTSVNAGSTVTNNTAGLFNEFEGKGGDDVITGNGQTRVSYYHATSSVTITIAANSWTSATSGGSGYATGDASIGTDHFTGVAQLRGGYFDDVLTGSNNPNNTTESFEGLGGNDLIVGGTGFDRAQYFQAGDDTGINVNLASGVVTGGVDTGTDTLRSIEAIYGTNFDDVYNAAGFSGSSTNAGNAGNNGAASSFNEFEGGGGDDTVTGNNNTRVYYGHSTGGVVVTLDPGTSGSGISVGNDSVGTDTFISGVTRVRGSEFNDIITGNTADNILEGQGGNDVIDGKGGIDTLTGGTGADIFVYGLGGGADTITDFNHGQGDRIDLRAFTSIHTVADVQALASAAASTVITFSAGNTLTLSGVTSASLQTSDFIFATTSGGPSVAITVQTTDGYDFGALYADLGNSNLGQHDSQHIFLVDTDKGISFEMIGSGIVYSSGHFTDGIITEIDILNTINPSLTTQDHVLVSSNGWSIDPTALFNGIAAYQNDPAVTAGLDTIFNLQTYSAVGTAGFADNHSQPHDGADTFFAGDHADVFNGMAGPFGPGDTGNDTVDYSHATSAVSVNLQTGATSGTAAAGDAFISIENLRGTNFDDALTGDGNNNVLEGGLGHNTLNGGGGSDTASYEHAASGVTVDLSVGTEQTVATGMFDTLVGIGNLRGSGNNDSLTGNSSNNYFFGNGGDDIFFGNGGSDTFAFAAAMGHGTIGDFATGDDKIELQFQAPFTDETSFQSWAISSGHITQQGADTLITFDAADSIRLTNITSTNLHANDFIVHPGS